MDKLSGKLITTGEGLHWLNFHTDFHLINALPPLTGHLFLVLNSFGQQAPREDLWIEKPKLTTCAQDVDQRGACMWEEDAADNSP
jgi:hypothetical protein